MDWAGIEQEGSEKKQGSKAWLGWRNKGIGSSDAAVLLGLSPWKNITELWEEKMGMRTQEFGFAQRSAMDRGVRLEPVIRKWYEDIYCQGTAEFKDDTAEHEIYKYMRASFDGRNKTLDRVLEIKAPNAKDHALAKNGIVPEKYVPQVQWLMLVGKHSFCDYVSYGSDDTYAVVNLIKDQSMQQELIKRAEIFWNHMQTKTPPDTRDFQIWNPSFSTPIEMPDEPTQLEIKIDPPQVTEQEIEAIVATALMHQKVMNDAEANFEALKEKLKTILGKDESKECGEAVFGWTKRKGNVNYKIIPELIGLDLEQFRSKDTRVFFLKKKELK